MWGRRPRLRRTPWSGSGVLVNAEADEGVGRGPGGPPYWAAFATIRVRMLEPVPELAPAIEVRNLRKVYDNKAAVDKAYSLLCLAAVSSDFLDPTEPAKPQPFKHVDGPGAARRRDHPKSSDCRCPGVSPRVKKMIGLVPDESMLFDHLTGREFIEFVGRIIASARSVARERARELIVPVRSGRQPAQDDRRLFQGNAQAGGNGGGAHPPAPTVPDGRTIPGRGCRGRRA